MRITTRMPVPCVDILDWPDLPRRLSRLEHPHTLGAMIILMPVVLPIVDAFGIDRVHFGIVTVFTLMIGILTPPLGIALYVMMDITKQPFEVLAKAVLPFLIPLIGALFVVAYFPQVSLYLPNLIMGPQ